MAHAYEGYEEDTYTGIDFAQRFTPKQVEEWSLDFLNRFNKERGSTGSKVPSRITDILLSVAQNMESAEVKRKKWTDIRKKTIELRELIADKDSENFEGRATLLRDTNLILAIQTIELLRREWKAGSNEHKLAKSMVDGIQFKHKGVSTEGESGLKSIFNKSEHKDMKEYLAKAVREHAKDGNAISIPNEVTARWFGTEHEFLSGYDAFDTTPDLQVVEGGVDEDLSSEAEEDVISTLQEEVLDGSEDSDEVETGEDVVEEETPEEDSFVGEVGAFDEEVSEETSGSDDEPSSSTEADTLDGNEADETEVSGEEFLEERMQGGETPKGAIRDFIMGELGTTSWSHERHFLTAISALFFVYRNDKDSEELKVLTKHIRAVAESVFDGPNPIIQSDIDSLKRIKKHIGRNRMDLKKLRI